MPQPPWTPIGSLQSDVQSITSQLARKADTHEIHSLNSKLDSLERTMREISTTLNGVLSRLQELEEKAIAREEANDET